MRVLCLELDGDLHAGAEREVEDLVDFLGGHVEDVGDEHVEHHDLVAECLVLLDDDCDLAVLVQGHDGFVVDQADHGRGGFGQLVAATRVVIDALQAVAQAQASALVGLDLVEGVGRHEIQVCALVRLVNEFRNSYCQLLLHTCDDAY